MCGVLRGYRRASVPAHLNQTARIQCTTVPLHLRRFLLGELKMELLV